MSEGATKHHHLVSKCLLRRWLPSPPSEQVIGRFGIDENRSKHSGLQPISISFEKVHPNSPQEFEDIWQKIEAKAGKVSSSLNASPGPLSEADGDVMKDLMVVHLVRSVAYIRYQRERFLSFIETGDLSHLPLAENDITDKDFREYM